MEAAAAIEVAALLGDASEEDAQRVAVLADRVVAMLTRLQSPFLRPSPMGYPVEYKGQRMLLGAAEVWVEAKDEGLTYAAPNLI